MKSPFWLALIVIGSLCLGGCTTYPTYSDAVRHFPPIQPGTGRFIIYLVNPIADGRFTIKIDGQTAGIIPLGYFLYFDHPAGNCLLAIKTGLIPRASTVLNLEDGQTQYIQITKETGLFGKFLLLPTDPDQASDQLAKCLYNKTF